MNLYQFSPISIHRDTHCLSRLRSATLDKLRAMNKNIAAFLRVGHAQLTNLRPIVSWNVKQSAIAKLTAHLGVERRAIENNVHFAGLFARQDCFHNRFRLEEIVSQEFSRWRFELSFVDTDFFLFLSSACARALFIHQFFESSDVNAQPTLSRH